MSEQPTTVDQPFQTMTAPEVAGENGFTPVSSDTGLSAVGDQPAPRSGDRSDVAPAASLVGSLSVFSLSDVLSMLASTSQTGELQVVADAAGGRLWLDGGRLSNAQVGSATTIGQSVFELACLDEGWFYFTVGAASFGGQPSVSVDAVLHEVRPQVDEWKEIRSVVPVDALVSLSPTPPGHDVQIRSDQWQILTVVGTSGRSVNDVLDAIGGDQMDGMRTLRDLSAAGLLQLTPASGRLVGDFGPPFARSPNGARNEATTTIPDPPGSTDEATDAPVVPPPPVAEPMAVGAEERSGGLAEVTVMPPPIAEDPWTPVSEPAAPDDGGAA
jgi:Domain of unknown function (DUF4388)